jgi:hypothetical protein
VSATLNPAAPNGAGGWYTGPVTVTVTGADDRPGAVSLEYRLDGGAWTAYSTPVSIADGSHTVEYRATDAAGNVSAVGSSAVKVDAVKPAVTVVGVADGGSYADDTSAVVSFQATDAGSGVASTTATLDGAAFTSGSTVNFATLGAGQHTLVVTSTDAAGNVTSQTLTFTVTATSTEVTFDSVRAAMDAYLADGELAAHVHASLLDRLDRAQAAAERGSSFTAIGMLDQFIARAKNQIKGDARDVEVRGDLVAMAEELRAKYQAIQDAKDALR